MRCLALSYAAVKFGLLLGASRSPAEATGGIALNYHLKKVWEAPFFFRTPRTPLEGEEAKP